MEFIGNQFTGIGNDKSSRELAREYEVKKKDQQIRSLRHSLTYTLVLDKLLVEAVVDSAPKKHRYNLARNAKKIWNKNVVRVVDATIKNQRFSPFFSKRPTIIP
jgi:hypothetical protein